MRQLAVATAVVAMVVSASAARAQGLWGYPAGVQVGGGAVRPVGEAWTVSGVGWDVAVAGDVEFRPGLAFRIDYFYARFAADETDVPGLSGPSSPPQSGTLSAKTQAHFASLDLVWMRAFASGRGSFYTFGGPAVARRRVTITSVRADGGAAFNEVLVDVCEPLWLQCASEVIPYHLAQGIRKSVDLGLNAGAGVTFDVGLRARVFVEGRYVFIDGPSFTDSSGDSRSSNAAYVPVTAGLRFQF